MKLLYTASPDETLRALGTNPSKGLSTSQVSERYALQEPNKIIQAQPLRWPKILLRQFSNFFIIILGLAALLSYALGDLIDAAAILAIIALNGILGFIQEWKAETALQNLGKMLSPRCRVVRDGLMQTIDAELLVSGDIVLLDSGNAVPADIRLIEAANLKADESALTGESTSVEKSTAPVPEDTHISGRSCMVWMGTHIVNGNALGVVTATGLDTEFGRIATLTKQIHETSTRLQRQLSKLAQQLTVLVAFVITAIMVIGWVNGKPALQMLMSGIALAVSAIPEGLPAVVTITLALGVRIMAQRKAILRHLQTAETLGAATVICTDKTGTLTKNEMTVQKIWLGNGIVNVSGVGYEPSGSFMRDGKDIDPLADAGIKAFLETARICNHALIAKTDKGWTALGSPTEAAFITLAKKAGLEDHPVEIAREFSFNSERKRMSVVEKTSTGLIVHVKGAPEILLRHAKKILIEDRECSLDDRMRQNIIQAYQKFAQEGLRTLAIARKTISSCSEIDEETSETELVFLGIAGIIDPPRPETKPALARALSAGIRVVMITGDSPDTALAIANQIGFGANKAINGADLANMNDKEILHLLDENVVFARTVPEDKYRIVKILQSANHLVAMTGDGVNDAPALKQADIGIAMGIRGTDVAKGASDMILSDDNFSSIIDAIEEGRRQYANIRKSVQYLISSNVGETITIFISILLGMPLILYPLQILWINLVTDSITALSLSVEKAEKNIMNVPPRYLDQPLLDKASILLLTLFGSYISLITLLLYGYHLGTSYETANTIAFTALVILSNILVLNFRSPQTPLYRLGLHSNPWLIAAVFSMIVLHMATLYIPALREVFNTIPLGWSEWLLIATASIPLVLVSEIYKAARFKKYEGKIR